MPFWFLVPIAYGIYKILESGSSQVKIPTPKRKVVCLVGRTASGKSSTANALLGKKEFGTGIEHGTTTEAKSVDYIHGYKLTDTPGLLDTINYEQIVLNEIRQSEIVLYVTTGQLYQKELEFLEKICLGFSSSQKLILFVNRQDEKERSQTTSSRMVERQAIIKQVQKWIPESNVAFGAAAPIKGGINQTPSIESLQSTLFKLLQK